MLCLYVRPLHVKIDPMFDKMTHDCFMFTHVCNSGRILCCWKGQNFSLCSPLLSENRASTYFPISTYHIFVYFPSVLCQKVPFQLKFLIRKDSDRTHVLLHYSL